MIDDLRFKIKYKLHRLSSYKLSEKDYTLLYDYIEALSENELVAFNELFEEYFHYRKYCGRNKYKITSNAIKLAIKISEQTPFRVFPFIETIARKSWSVKYGTYSFGMRLIDENYSLGKWLYSNDYSRLFLNKKRKIEYCINYINDIEISAEKI